MQRRPDQPSYVRLTKMPGILRQPYPALSSPAKRWRLCFLFGIFVSLFLLVFQPFAISSDPDWILLSLGYGLTCFVTMAILNIGIVPAFPSFFNEQKWTTGRELSWSLLNIISVGFANALYTSLVFSVAFSFKTILIFGFYTVAVGILPVIISVLIKLLTLEKKYERESVALNERIEISTPADLNKPQEIVIRSEAEKENLTVNTDDLLFIRAADNYAEVFYTENGAVKKRLLRTTLKRISGDLPPGELLFRCHKSYLVNPARIKHVSGNAQGLKIHLPGTEEIVPVSRNLTETVKQRLAVRP